MIHPQMGLSWKWGISVSPTIWWFITSSFSEAMGYILGMAMDPFYPFLYCAIQFWGSIVLTLLVVLSRKETHQDGQLPLAIRFMIRLCWIYEPLRTYGNRRVQLGGGSKCYITTFWVEAWSWEEGTAIYQLEKRYVLLSAPHVGVLFLWMQLQSHRLEEHFLGNTICTLKQRRVSRSRNHIPLLITSNYCNSYQFLRFLAFLAILVVVALKTTQKMVI